MSWYYVRERNKTDEQRKMSDKLDESQKPKAVTNSRVKAVFCLFEVGVLSSGHNSNRSIHGFSAGCLKL